MILTWNFSFFCKLSRFILVTDYSMFVNLYFHSVMLWLQPATKEPLGRLSPRRAAEENGKKQAENWWVRIRAVLQNRKLREQEQQQNR